MSTAAVIVTHNSAHCVGDSLSSLAQSGLDSVVIVDNRSTDATVDVCRSYTARFPTFQLVELPENVGFGKAVNIGVGATTVGSDILVINPDTLVTEDALRRSAQVLADTPRVGMVGCRLVMEDGAVDPACLRNIPSPVDSLVYFASKGMPLMSRFSRYHPPPDHYSKVLSSVEAINGAYMYIRRSVFDRLSGFDERFFMYGEDLDLCVRLRDLGFDIFYIGTVDVVHLKGRSSSTDGLRSSEAKIAFEEAMAIFFDIHQAPAMSPLVRRMASAALEGRARLRLS